MPDTPPKTGGTVKTPFGTVKKKSAVLIGAGVVVVLIVGVIEIRKNKSLSPGTTATGATDAFPSDGTTGNPSDPNSVDPASGLTYGDEANTTGGATSEIDPATGYPYGSTQDQEALAAQNGGATSEADIDPLTGFPYGSPGDIAALNAGTGSSTTGTVGGGTPIPIDPGSPDTTGSGVPGVNPGGPITGPSPGPHTGSGGGTAGKPSGLKLHPGEKDITADWKPAAHATSYTVTCTVTKGGPIRVQVKGTSTSFNGLNPGTRHTITVKANPNGGSISGSTTTTSAGKKSGKTLPQKVGIGPGKERPL